MKYSYLQATLWGALYVAIVLAPMGLMLVGPTPPGRGFWVEFGVALGFVGFTMLALQFAVTGRYRDFAMGFGSDNILQFHLATGVVAMVMVMAHPAVIILADQGFIDYLDPRVNFMRALALWPAAGAAILLVVLSLWRKRFRLAYEWWRLSHGLLAFFVMFVGMVHVIQVAWFTDPWWKRGVMVTIAVGAILLLVHTRIGKPLILKRHPYQVTGVIEERADAWTLVVEPVDHEGMTFEAGQYAWLTLGDTPFSLQQNPFSMASSANDPLRLLFTAKVAGDFTETWPEVKPGTRAYLEGPHGAFTVRWGSPKGSVFVAGGIGITPVMSILRTLAEREDPRPCMLIYANKSWDDVVFRDEIEELRERLDLKVVHVLEEPPEDWEGEEGFVTHEVLDRHLSEPYDGWFYYICGPAPMMDMVEEDLVERDIPLPMIMSERFEIV